MTSTYVSSVGSLLPYLADCRCFSYKEANGVRAAGIVEGGIERRGARGERGADRECDGLDGRRWTSADSARVESAWIIIM